MSSDLARAMHDLVRRLFPICRSLTGDGVRETLRILSEHIPLTTHEVPTGTDAFDWTVPREWNVRDAYIADMSGNRVVDFKKNNLHLMGYSVPVDKTVSRQELEEHLESIPEQPDAIPYVVSYYKERWKFCLTHNDRLKLNDDQYRVVIDSTLADGHLTYADMVLAGQTEEEVYLCSYVCHPSMANNELSGPVVLTHIVEWLMKKPRRYTYRIALTPETLGSIVYLSRNLETMKKRTVAGFNLSCIGDDRGYSCVSSRYGDTYADKIARNVLRTDFPGEHAVYSFLDRGSDERQYCSPGVDLPLVTLCRTKYNKFPEYHTSLDDLGLVSPAGLLGGFTFVQKCLRAIERNGVYKVDCLCEPQLGKRGLHPTMSRRNSSAPARGLKNVIAYSDGRNDLVDISNWIGMSLEEIYPIVKSLYEAKLLVLQT